MAAFDLFAQLVADSLDDIAVRKLSNFVLTMKSESMSPLAVLKWLAEQPARRLLLEPSEQKVKVRLCASNPPRLPEPRNS